MQRSQLLPKSRPYGLVKKPQSKSMRARPGARPVPLALRERYLGNQVMQRLAESNACLKAPKIARRGDAYEQEAERLSAQVTDSTCPASVPQEASAHDQAEELPKNTAARAVTFDNHLCLGAGESQNDLDLMTHETAHALQQDGIMQPRLLDAHMAETLSDEAGETPETAVIEVAEAQSGPQSPPERAGVPPSLAVAAMPMIVNRITPEAVRLGETAAVSPGIEMEPAIGAEIAASARGLAETAIREVETPSPVIEAAPEAAAATESSESERLQGLMKRLGEAAAQQKGAAATPASQTRAARRKAVNASAAAPSPANEAECLGQAAQIETMNEQQAGEVDQHGFLALVRRRLTELDLPANPREMDRFRESGGASGLREGVVGGVIEQTGAAQRDIRAATEAEPVPAAAREVIPLVEPGSAGRVPSLQAEEALPLPRHEESVTRRLEENRQQVDHRLAEATVAEARLQRESDPDYVAVREAQQALHDHADNAPKSYRREEQVLLAEEARAIDVEEQGAVREIEAARTAADMAQVAIHQQAMSQEALKRQQVADRLESIYTDTQEAVQEKLTWLNEEVEERLTQGEARAREGFESHVGDQMFAWKLRRYGRRALIPGAGILVAAGTWLYDQWVGIDQFPGIIAIFEGGRRRYLTELDMVIGGIACLVDEALAWCQNRIRQGRLEVQGELGSLRESSRQIGEETFDSISGRFDELRQNVETRREELASRLVQHYQESRQALDERLAEMQARNGGLRDRFYEALDAVLNAIKELRNLLPSLARHVPGYTLFTVIIGFNPLSGDEVERNAMSLLEGFMALVPFGTFIFDSLQERGILVEAFQWVEGQLARLDLSRVRIEQTIDAAWVEILLAAGPSYNLAVLGRHFGRLLIDATTFAVSLVGHLTGLIKDLALTVADELLAENRAWGLIKKILRHDPLKGVPVAASTVEIVEDFLVLIGKEPELAQMREQGVVEESAAWLDTQLGTFNSLLDELRGLFTIAWEAIQPRSLPRLGANLESLAIRVTGFLQQVWEFARSVAAKVWELVKEAVLGWLQANATHIPGYHLLTVILQKDVITQAEVRRTPTNLIRGFMSLLPGGEQPFRQMQESGVIPAAARRIEALIGDLGISWAFVRGLFLSIWDSLSARDLASPIATFGRIKERFGEPLRRLVTFVVEVIKTVLELVLQRMNFPMELVGSIIRNALYAFDDIRRQPMAFIRNMLAGVRLGFSSFFDNIGQHLKRGLTKWLFRALHNAGIQPPADLSLRSVLGFALPIMAITTDNIWDKLAERMGQENADRIRSVIDRLAGVWSFVRDVQDRGVVAIGEHIQSQISDLWNIVLLQVREWVLERIINRARRWLLSLLAPTGVMLVINSFRAFFRAVQSAITYLRDILAIINDYVSTMASIARGDVQAGAGKIESGLAGAIPIAIGFLANQFGLGNIGEKIREIISGVHEVVDRALNWLIDGSIAAFKALLPGVRTATATVTNWWNEQQEFRDAEGTEHRLYFEGEGDNAQLTVASNPTNARIFLQKFPASSKQEEALMIAKALNRRPPSQKTLDNLNARLIRLKELIVQLLESSTLRDGSQTHPFEIKWHKPRSVDYPPISVRRHPSDSAPTLADITQQTAICVLSATGASDGRMWNMDRWKMTEFIRSAESSAKETSTPAQRQAARRTARLMSKTRSRAFRRVYLGEPLTCVTIGVLPRYHVDVNSILGPKPAAGGNRNRRVVALYRTILNRAGYMGGDSIDHVTDLSMGGPDANENLWPLARNPAGNQWINVRVGDPNYGRDVALYGGTGARPDAASIRSNLFAGRYFIVKEVTP
jgi:hypothetical protein